VTLLPITGTTTTTTTTAHHNNKQRNHTPRPPPRPRPHPQPQQRRQRKGEYYTKDAALPLLIADSIFKEEFDSKIRRALQNKFAPSRAKQPLFQSFVRRASSQSRECFLRTCVRGRE
jgi:hypothetical protein